MIIPPDIIAKTFWAANGNAALTVKAEFGREPNSAPDGSVDGIKVSGGEAKAR